MKSPTSNVAKIPAIICDLDGTLCNDDFRRETIKDIVGLGAWTEAEYTRYYELMHTDIPFDHVKEILHRFEHDHKIFFVTGRPERFRGQTISWIKTHTNLKNDPIMYMRPDRDFRHDIIIKTEIYEKWIKPDYDVVFVLEDRTRVVKMWRDLGLYCLQVQQSDF